MEPEDHDHDWRVDPYTFYPRPPFGDATPVKVVCIVSGCGQEFIGAKFYSPMNKESWDHWTG